MNSILKPDISVVVPVYNTGAYLEATLDSVVNQTLKKIEIIVVNDGSTDNSAEIINHFQENDSRIVVINQENAGLSMARNAGINKATGEYIYFMDSDDLLDQEALMSCHRFAVDNDLDLVCFDAQTFMDEGLKEEASFLFDYSRSALLSKGIYTGRDFLTRLVNGGGYKASVCLYILKKSLLDDLSLSFYKEIYHEDELFTPQILLNANHIGYLPYGYFKRRIRAGSIMQNAFSAKNLTSYLTVVKELKNSSLIKNKDRATVDVLLIDILNVVTYRSNSLFIKDRANLLVFLLKEGFLTKIKPKNLLVLMFPFLISIKKVFKK